MMQDRFFDTITAQIAQIRTTQREKINSAARMMADTIKGDGIIHIFGSGHSQIAGLEMFYRAGGLVPVNVIYAPCLSVYPHAAWSTYFERQEGLAEKLLERENIQPGDMAIVTSVSGRNAVPIEMAMALKERGVRLVVLTAGSYIGKVTSRHPSGKLLYELGDIVLDMCCAYGDASLDAEGLEGHFAPTSSIVAFTLLEALVAQTVELLLQDGVEPPLFTSSNVDGGDAKNEALMEKYKDRIHGF